MDSKKFYITTSIPYANAAPHVGHILDPLIADVLARHHRLKGHEVRFLVGTDEHGAKIVRKAGEEQKTPRELVDENSAKFREMHRLLNISWDDFIRTTDRERHWPGAQKMWQALVKSGDVYWKKYQGFYCVGHEAFITEKDLLNGVCQDHQREPEMVEEENWFFRLSRYSDDIVNAITSGRLRVEPEGRRNEILAFIRAGLDDISISRPQRDIPWGVPVPNDSTQTMYVWMEALVSYLSSLGYGRDDSTSVANVQKWWPAEAQVVGKDNLRFHTAIWPGMLISAGLELPRLVFVHGFVNVEGKKISKTVGNVIAPEEVVAKYGTDAVRYFFLRDFPSHEDGNFSYRSLKERYNGELANGLGNLVARVAALGEKISPVKFDAGDILPEAKKEVEEVTARCEQLFKSIRLNEVLADVWRLVGFADRYINDTKPWAITDLEELRVVIVNAVYIISALADFLRPFIPQTAERIEKQIYVRGDAVTIHKGEVLFPRLG